MRWQLEKAETELWKEPHDSILEAVAAAVTKERPVWQGSSTELVKLIRMDIQPNALVYRINAKSSQLKSEYGVCHEISRNHAGRYVKLTLDVSKA